MADTVSTQVLSNGPRNYVVRLQGTSDATGESAVKKVDASTLFGPDGQNAPTGFSIKKVDYSISGFTSVQLLFDATTDDVALTLSGDGNKVFDPPIPDPRSTGTTGDILLTSNGASSGDAYDITLSLIKK